MILLRRIPGFWVFAVVSWAISGGFWCPTSSAAGLPACEATKPTIEHVTLTEVTLAGVTLEAQINPQGSETTYEFKIVWQALNPPERGEELPGGPRVQTGHIDAGAGDVTVSAMLSELQPGYTYWYEVIASNIGGETTSGAYPFGYLNTGAYPNGTGSGPPYKSEGSPCAAESGRLASEKTYQQYKEEQQAKEAVAAKTAEETTLKNHPKEQAPAYIAPRRCVVPSLSGDRPKAARRAITGAHCQIGEVKRPRHYRGALLVTRQTPRPGASLINGARIVLTLGPVHLRRHKPERRMH